MWREREGEGFICLGFGLGHKACLPDVGGVVARIQMKPEKSPSTYIQTRMRLHVIARRKEKRIRSTCKWLCFEPLFTATSPRRNQKSTQFETKMGGRKITQTKSIHKVVAKGKKNETMLRKRETEKKPNTSSFHKSLSSPSSPMSTTLFSHKLQCSRYKPGLKNLLPLACPVPPLCIGREKWTHVPIVRDRHPRYFRPDHLRPRAF